MDEEELLGTSYCDSAWVPQLNPDNIMDYFSRSRFYDKTCNNELIKMQRQSMDRLYNMTGIEYRLEHAQLPILYIIVKQYRQNPESVTPMAYYYIIAGTIYQSPDLNTLVNSRILNTTFNLNSALNTAISHIRYHPSKGYWWQFKEETQTEEGTENKQQASWFQRQRVDLLLGELVKQYPMKVALPPPQQTTESDTKPDEDMLKGADIRLKAGTKRPASDPDLALKQPDSKHVRVKVENIS